MGNTLEFDISNEEMKKAIEVEFPKLEHLRTLVKKLEIKELGYRECYSIAPVATDGGENRLIFEPLNLEILRVVDSEGRERIQKIIPVSTDPDVFSKMFEEIEVLKRFLKRLDTNYENLSYFLPTKKEEDEYVNVRNVIRNFRDILEWAVLLDIAWEPEKTPILLLRDGLLRSISLKDSAMKSLAVSLKQAYQEKGTLLIGVAKRAKVLNYYSIALGLENKFNRSYPCYCELPKDLEEESYRHASSWVRRRSFGDLYFVKFSENREGLILPVEIPSWLRDKRKEILEYAAWTANLSFPVIGYPSPLIKAHENAVLTGIEMEYLASLLKTRILELYDESEQEKILSNIWFKKALLKEGME